MTFPCFVKALDAAANVPSDAEHYRERARLCCLSHREFNRPCMGRDIGGGNIRRTNCPPLGVAVLFHVGILTPPLPSMLT